MDPYIKVILCKASVKVKECSSNRTFYKPHTMATSTMTCNMAKGFSEITKSFTRGNLSTDRPTAKASCSTIYQD